MFDSFAETMSLWLDAAADFMWRQFDKDMEMTEAILARIEVFFDRRR